MSINKLYGVLKGSSNIVMGTPGYRFSDVYPTEKQSATLKGLLDADPQTRALQIDCIIKLLQCSPLWPDFERDVDPVNTYTIASVILTDTTDIADMKNCPPITGLLNWAAGKPTPTTGKFVCAENDPELDVACSKLMAIVAEA